MGIEIKQSSSSAAISRLKIDDADPGDKFQLNISDKDSRQSKTVEFKIIENSWYPSPVKSGAFFHGVKVKFPDNTEEILDPITLQFCKKI